MKILQKKKVQVFNLFFLSRNVAEAFVVMCNIILNDPRPHSLVGGGKRFTPHQKIDRAIPSSAWYSCNCYIKILWNENGHQVKLSEEVTVANAI